MTTTARMPLAAALITGIAVLTALALAGQAGAYPVRACAAAEHGTSTAFLLKRTPRRYMKVARDCGPGRGSGGIVTRNRVTPGSAPKRARAYAIFRAPSGTVIDSMRWGGRFVRRDCAWAAELVAEYPNGHQKTIFKKGCSRSERASAANFRTRFIGHNLIGGSTKVFQRVRCLKKRCGTSGRRARVDARTFSAQLNLTDVQKPNVRITGGRLASGAWVRSDAAVSFTATDNTGIQREALFLGSRQWNFASLPCLFTRPAPCSNNSNQLSPGVRDVSEGTQRLTVTASDAAGNTGAAAGTARIDNSPPGRVETALAGGEGWRRTPGAVLQWANPGEGDRAPINGAFFQTRNGGAKWSTARAASGANLQRLSLQAPVGQTQVRMWRRDAAGNASAALASDPATMRYDPEAPSLAFQPSPATDPTRLAVAVIEKVSGVAGGSIEVSRQGTNNWQGLATRREKGRLEANIDDSKLPAGTYVARAQATDLAGNVGVATRPGSFRLPLRVGSSLQAGVIKKKVVRRRVRRHGKRRTVRRRVTVFRRSARPHLGRRVKTGGRLTNGDGQPLGGQPIYVYSQSRVDAPRLIAKVKTNRRGSYRYIAKASTSRTLTFAYPGTKLQLPAVGQVKLLVPASSTFRPSRRRVHNGQSVKFRGRVRGGPIPATGKLVELQVLQPGGVGWTTFRTTRSDGHGRWKIRYRFTNTACKGRYRLRAHLPLESGFPYQTGRSRSRVVKVRGRC